MKCKINMGATIGPVQVKGTIIPGLTPALNGDGVYVVVIFNVSSTGGVFVGEVLEPNFLFWKIKLSLGLGRERGAWGRRGRQCNRCMRHKAGGSVMNGGELGQAWRLEVGWANMGRDMWSVQAGGEGV